MEGIPVRYSILTLVLLLAAPLVLHADDKAKPSQTSADWRPPFPVDEETMAILEEINSLNPYQAPRLPLKNDENYAHIPRDVEPFRHVVPYKRHFLTQMEYTGAGRSIPEPDELKTVKIGFIGPIEATVSVATGGRSHEETLGRKMLQGCLMAIEEANAQGGYLRRRIPFELIVKNDNGLWGSSGNTVIDMAYKDKVWAMLGTIDGANSHIAIRVALKAEVPMMNTGDTDPTFIETNIPWCFRVIGDDRQMCYLLADYVYRKLGIKQVAVIRASNRYGRFGMRKFRDSARRLERPISLEMAYPVGSEDFSLHLERIRAAKVEAVVHWGDDTDGARILNQMRASGMKQPFFACDRCASAQFVKLAGKNAEGVVCCYPWDPERQDSKLYAFRERFRKRFANDEKLNDTEVDAQAAHAYDGMNMLLWAIQVAGLNRAKIRDVLAYRTRPWPGVSGDIAFSAALDNMREVYLAKCEKGKWNYYSRDDLAIPRGQARPAGDRGELIRAKEQETPAPKKPSAPGVYRDGRKTPLSYAGPGRDTPEPTELSEVRIGYFGPSDPSRPDGGDLWSAARLAAEEANRQGGYGGKPFRLIAGWSDSPWTAGANHVTRMVFVDQVWAVVGGIDGPTTHLAEQVAAKALVPIVSPVSTDRTANSAFVPWMFSCLPGDDRLAPLLADRIVRDKTQDNFAVVSSDDHDSRVFHSQLKGAFRKQNIAPRYEFVSSAASDNSAEIVGRLMPSKPRAVVILAGPTAGARLVVALRKAGYGGTILGGPWMGRRQFDERAGSAADGLIFPALYVPGGNDKRFFDQFRGQVGTEPDYAAAATYDAVSLVVAAIHKAGLNRARIADALRSLSPRKGASGIIQWDTLGGNSRPVALGEMRSGRLVSLSAK